MLTAWSKNGWSPWHLVAAGVMALAAVATHYTAWVEIATKAYSDLESSHIFLVLPVAAALVYVRRQRFRHCRPRGGIWGVVILAAGVIISIIGFHKNTYVLWEGGALLALIGSVVTVLGRDVVVAFLPAVLVLAFLVPVPGRIRRGIAIPLQGQTAEITVDILSAAGEDVKGSANKVEIHGHPVSIAEECNGMRMVFALFLVSYAYAFCVPLKGYVRAIILLGSPLSALLWNVIRLIPTLYLFGYAPQWVAKFFHDYIGWVLLPLAFLLLMGIIAALKWALLPVAPYTLAYD